MKKVILIFIAVLITTVISAQNLTVKGNITANKLGATLNLNGVGSVINFYNGDVTLTQSSNLLTLAGGNISLGSNSLFSTGSFGSTGNRILKGWFTDLELTNLPTVGGVSMSTLFIPVNNSTLTGLTTVASLRIGSTTLTATGVELNKIHGLTPSTNEMNSLLGIEGNVQTSLNAKASLVSPIFTSSITIPSDFRVPLLPENMTPDTILVWHNGKIYYSTIGNLNNYIEPPVTPSLTAKYVAVNGNDNNDGTYDEPWGSWQYAFNQLSAGDTLYVRGGTYRTTGSTSSDTHVRIDDLTGTSQNPICILNYPEEVPVLNLDNIGRSTTSYCFVMYISNCDYLKIKGLRITSALQSSAGAPMFGWAMYGSTHDTIEAVTVDHIGGSGYSLMSGCDHIYFKNCDAHHDVDSIGNPNGNNAPFEDANGFQITGGSTATNITFDGCRAWNIADDGWDFFATDGIYTLKNCWSFWNGYNDSFGLLGNGQGFKLGPNETDKSSTHLRTLTNCIAAKNRTNGFDQNTADYSCIHWFYNNLAFDNGSLGFQFHYPAASGIVNIFKNNAAWSNDGFAEYYFNTGIVHTNNTWNGSVTVNNSDFENLQISQLAGDRGTDGRLPSVTFGHLVTGSDLINAGVDVGLPYQGAAPDMGAYEKQ